MFSTKSILMIYSINVFSLQILITPSFIIINNKIPETTFLSNNRSITVGFLWEGIVTCTDTYICGGRIPTAFNRIRPPKSPALGYFTLLSMLYQRRSTTSRIYCIRLQVPRMAKVTG